jgi:hypothetical protein
MWPVDRPAIANLVHFLSYIHKPCSAYLQISYLNGPEKSNYDSCTRMMPRSYGVNAVLSDTKFGSGEQNCQLAIPQGKSWKNKTQFPE